MMTSNLRNAVVVLSCIYTLLPYLRLPRVDITPPHKPTILSNKGQLNPTLPNLPLSIANAAAYMYTVKTPIFQYEFVYTVLASYPDLSAYTQTFTRDYFLIFL